MVGIGLFLGLAVTLALGLRTPRLAPARAVMPGSRTGRRTAAAA
jgi:hypothetical protein